MKDVERERRPDDFDPEREGKPRNASHAAPRDQPNYGKQKHEQSPRDQRSQQSAERRGPVDQDDLDDEDTAPDTSRRYEDDDYQRRQKNR